MDAAPALLLLAHGARDRRWAEPFRRLLAAVRSARPGRPVELAFLETMQPDLETAAGLLAAQGARAIVVVPVFLGEGAHVREDVPRRIQQARQALPEVAIEVVAAVGEDPGVLAALAAYCVLQGDSVKPGLP